MSVYRRKLTGVLKRSRSRCFLVDSLKFKLLKYYRIILSIGEAKCFPEICSSTRPTSTRSPSFWTKQYTDFLWVLQPICLPFVGSPRQICKSASSASNYAWRGLLLNSIGLVGNGMIAVLRLLPNIAHNLHGPARQPPPILSVRFDLFIHIPDNHHCGCNRF